MRDLAELTIEDFAACVGEAFATPDGRALRLAVVARLGDPGRDGRRAPFSLTFAEPGGAVYPQGIVRLSCPTLGALDLFVVPLGRDSTETHYEAIVT